MCNSAKVHSNHCSSVLKESEANRIVEIKEELEALDAEKQVYASSYEDDAIDNRRLSCPISLVRDVVNAYASNTRRGENTSREKSLGGAISYLVSTSLEHKMR